MNGKVLPGDAHEHTSLGRLFHGFIHPRSNAGPPLEQAVADSASGRAAVRRAAAVLAAVAFAEFVVAGFTQSVALVADGMNALAAAATAIPVLVAASPSTAATSKLFNYGRERAIDLLALIALVALAVATLGVLVLAVARLWLFGGPVSPMVIAIAGVVAFAAHEGAASLRLTAGRSLKAKVLAVDGRATLWPGAAALLVVAGAIGVGAGAPWADSVVAVIIAAIVLRRLWRASQAATTRLIDGVEEDLTWRLARVVEEDAGVANLIDVRARWAGHRLHVEITIGVDGECTLAATRPLTQKVRAAMAQKFPELKRVNVAVVPIDVPAAAGKDTRR